MSSVKVIKEKSFFKKIELDIKNHPEFSKFIFDEDENDYIFKFATPEEAKKFGNNLWQNTDSKYIEDHKRFQENILKSIEEGDDLIRLN